MGAGAGIFRMTNVPVKTVESDELKLQVTDLAEAYAQSSSQDKLIAREFDFALIDGLDDGPLRKQPRHSGAKTLELRVGRPLSY